MRKVYYGRDDEVSFYLDICIHVGECLRGDRQVFKLDRRPWVLPDAGEAEVIAQVVERCPSGALQYRRLDGGDQEKFAEITTITPMRDGPLLVTGRVVVRHEDGTVETQPRATLCRRCLSEDKPLWDTQHPLTRVRAPGVPSTIHLSKGRPPPDRH